MPNRQTVFKKLLLTTDLNEPIEPAATFISGFARTFGSSIHILHVHEAGLGSKRRLSKAEPGLSLWVKSLAEHGCEPTSALRIGIPSQEIIAEAHTIGADLLVTLDAGRRTLQNRLLGSTTSRLTVSSSRPILVATPTAKAGQWPPSSILFPIDFSSFAQAASMLVGELTEHLDCVATMLHVDSQLNLEGTAPLNRHADLMSACDRMLQPIQCAERFSRLVREVNGTIGNTISTEAKAHDLIVMAATGKNALQRLLNGSVTEQVLRSSPCGVLVV